MVWAIFAGSLAGLVLGYLGAGGTVVGLPFVIYLAGLSPHIALGTNALGVSLIALALLIWRIWQRQLPIRAGLIFAVSGLAGNYGVLGGLAGIRLGQLISRQNNQRIFAAFLVLLGIYMIVQ